MSAKHPSSLELSRSHVGAPCFVKVRVPEKLWLAIAWVVLKRNHRWINREGPW